jgi:outer membrane protein
MGKEITMKQVISIAALICILTTPVALRAQTPTGQLSTGSVATGGVVTVSFNAAVFQTAEAKRELGALQTKFAPRQAQLKALSDEIEGLQKQLQTTADKLSDAERATREQSFSAKEKQLQRDEEDFKNDSQSESQQIFQGVAQKVYAFLQTYAQQHGYPVVIERGSDASPVVWYAAANLDITDQLIQAYNAQSGVTAPAAASKPSAAKPSSATTARPQSASPAPK